MSPGRRVLHHLTSAPRSVWQAQCSVSFICDQTDCQGSPKGNDSDVFDETGDRKRGVSRLRDLID